MKTRHFMPVLLALALLGQRPESAAAQLGCGDLCTWSCYPYFNMKGEGNFCEYCHQYKSVCTYGGCELGCLISASDNTPSVQVLVDAVQGAATDEDVRQVLAEYGGRLLLNTVRSMVVVQGGCESVSPAAVVFLEPDQMSRFERLGTRAFDQFLAEQAQFEPAKPESED